MAVEGGSPPNRRKDSSQAGPTVGDPVKVTKTNGDNLLGIVREREEFESYDAPARVVVEGKDELLNTSAERVEVAEGTHAELVLSIVGGEDV